MNDACKKFAREDAVSWDLWLLQQIPVIISSKIHFFIHMLSVL